MQIYIYALNIEALKYIRQILADLIGIIDSHTILVRDFSITLSTMDRSSRQKIDKETLNLNYTLGQMPLTDAYRTFHPIAPKYNPFQMHMKHSPGENVCQVTKQVSRQEY